MQAIDVHQLTVNYDKTPILWDLTLSIPQGKLVGIFGPNGAGKSTFLKSAIGIVKPVSGKVSFLDQPYHKVRRKIAYVPQRESVDWDFPITVKEVVLMGRYGKLFHWIRKADRKAAMQTLEMVGMADYADRQISQLSGGQQQRVFIARSLVQNADIYLMDEPFAGVDMATEQTIIEIMRNLRDEGKTVLVVQHDLKTAGQYYDWAILLNMRLVAAGPIDEVFTKEMLERTYGTQNVLFGEAVKLSQEKTFGL